MKEQLLESVTDLKRTFDKLNHVWGKMDWSRVPIQISEQYPFHCDLNELIAAVEAWKNTIERS